MPKFRNIAFIILYFIGGIVTGFIALGLGSDLRPALLSGFGFPLMMAGELAIVVIFSIISVLNFIIVYKLFRDSTWRSRYKTAVWILDIVLILYAVALFGFLALLGSGRGGGCC